MAEWSDTYIDALPDSSFLYTAPGGRQNGQGQTSPRALRAFPYRDASGCIDQSRLDFALSRIPESKLTADIQARLQAKARGLSANHRAASSHPSNMPAFALSNAADGLEPVAVTRNGQQVVRFRKDIAHTGIWCHPTEGWKLNVTPERMDGWIAAFRRMRDDGIDVDAVKDHSFKSDDSLGYVTDMWREGDTLYGTHEVQGKDQIDLVRRVKNVSPWVELDHHGGPTGTSYGEAIIHSSLCLQPVQSGQTEFVELPEGAVSGRAASRVPVYSLSTAQSTEAHDMDPKLLAKIQAALGLDTLNESGIGDAIDHYAKAMSTDLDKTSKALTAAQGEIVTLTAKVASRKSDDKKADPPAMDGEMLDMLVEAAEGRLESLVLSGRIVPAVSKKLHAVLIGEVGKRNAYALSRTVSRTERSVIRQVLDALADNDPKILQEQTSAQAHVLSREQGDGPDKDAAAAFGKQMRQAASGKAD